jgi:Peptidase_C39 like family
MKGILLSLLFKFRYLYIIAKVIFMNLFLLAPHILLSTNVLKHDLNVSDASLNLYEWESTTNIPFNELIVSWNANRPTQGDYDIFISIKQEEWTSWMKFASWGSSGQQTYERQSFDGSIVIYQDTLELKGNPANQFRIRVASQGGANLTNFKTLYASFANSQSLNELQHTCENLSVFLPVSGLSQMTLNHASCGHMCSPTSTTAVIRYLQPAKSLDPLHFAQQVWDKGFDIYGNWIFNSAQAYVELEGLYNTWVARLTGLNELIQYLLTGTPVVVSVREPLPGSAVPYTTGHLIVVCGYDSATRKIACMDPAFSQDSQTLVQYDVDDFLKAWQRRGYIAYLFALKGQRGQ